MILMNVIYLIYALLSMSLQDTNDSPDRLRPVQLLDKRTSLKTLGSYHLHHICPV